MKFRATSFKTTVIAAICLLSMWVARAEVVVNGIEPLDQTVEIDCDGDGNPEDILHLTGDLHVLITSTENKAGVVTVKTHFQPVNVSAVGEITGDTYRAVGITRDSDVIRGDHETFTFVNNFYMIGTKSGIKSLFHVTFHVTVVNGEVVVEHDKVDARCR